MKFLLSDKQIVQWCFIVTLLYFYGTKENIQQFSTYSTWKAYVHYFKLLLKPVYFNYEV